MSQKHLWKQVRQTDQSTIDCKAKILTLSSNTEVLRCRFADLRAPLGAAIENVNTLVCHVTQLSIGEQPASPAADEWTAEQLPSSTTERAVITRCADQAGALAQKFSQLKDTAAVFREEVDKFSTVIASERANVEHIQRGVRSLLENLSQAREAEVKMRDVHQQSAREAEEERRRCERTIAEAEGRRRELEDIRNIRRGFTIGATIFSLGLLAPLLAIEFADVGDLTRRIDENRGLADAAAGSLAQARSQLSASNDNISAVDEKIKELQKIDAHLKGLDDLSASSKTLRHITDQVAEIQAHASDATKYCFSMSTRMQVLSYHSTAKKLVECVKKMESQIKSNVRLVQFN